MSEFPHAKEENRRVFTLSADEAVGLQQVANYGGGDARNEWWLRCGERHGFIWTTIEGLAWLRETGPDEQLIGATFTAVAHPIATDEPASDPEALAWLRQDQGDQIPEVFSRETGLRAWSAGRDRGFAMGSVAPQPNDSEALARIAAARGPKPSWMMETEGGGWSDADHLRWTVDVVDAWQEWQRKTDWVQGRTREITAVLGAKGVLGLHRADVMTALIRRAYPGVLAENSE